MTRGGKRPGAGRPKGVRNKATIDEKATLSELAKKHAPEALAALARIAANGESEAAVVSASVAILDRAFGRPIPQVPQPESDPIGEILREISRKGSAAPIRPEPDEEEVEP